MITRFMALRRVTKVGTRPLLAVAVAALALAAPALAEAAPSPAGLAGVALNGSVDLAWQPAAGASAYNVYRGTTPTTVTTLVSPVGGVAATGFTDSSVVNATTYYYVVKPIVAGSESGSSATISATPRARACSTGNDVVLENCFPGSSGWKILGTPPAASAGGIEGYATASSVNKTDSIGLKVTSANSITFHVDLYRRGYYGGTGGRLLSPILDVAR